jgi:hypothetical protein
MRYKNCSKRKLLLTDYTEKEELVCTNNLTFMKFHIKNIICNKQLKQTNIKKCARFCETVFKCVIPFKLL